jgi:purine nucleosidase
MAIAYPHRLIVDTDPGVDDAVALIMLTSRRNVDIACITTVAGNVGVDQAYINAQFILDQAGRTGIQVFSGAATPLLRRLETAEHIHGQFGLGDVVPPEPKNPPQTETAVEVILRLTREHPGEITFLALGPLTNLALAIRADPGVVDRFSEVIIMGGSGDGIGNTTPVSEFNFWIDPEAASIVLGSGLCPTLVGCDISRKYAYVDEDVKNGIAALGTPLAELVTSMSRPVERFGREVMGIEGYPLPDPAAIAVLLERQSVVTGSSLQHVSVVLSDDSSRGQMVFDRPGTRDSKGNAIVVTEIDRSRFIFLLLSSLGLGDPG